MSGMNKQDVVPTQLKSGLESGLESGHALEEGIDSRENGTLRAATGRGHSNASLKRTISLLITLAACICLVTMFVERSGAEGQAKLGQQANLGPQAKKVKSFDDQITS